MSCKAVGRPEKKKANLVVTDQTVIGFVVQAHYISNGIE